MQYSRSHTSANQPTGKELSFREHIWFLSRLLQPRKHEDRQITDNRMCRYLVATCFQKLNRRIGNATVSKPLITALKLQLPANFAPSWLDERPPMRKLLSDRDFLTTFILVDGKKLREFPSGLKISRIIAKAKQAAASGAESALTDVRLYDEDTCREICEMLPYMLDTYKLSIGSVTAIRTGKPQTNYASLEDALTDAMDYGQALLKLRRGAALPHYLDDIAPFLLNSLWKYMDSNITPDNNNNGDESDDRDDDPDLEAPQLDTGSISEQYLKWLSVILAHFDGMRIVRNALETIPLPSRNPISFRILICPSPDRRLVPWRSLFTVRGLPWGETRITNHQQPLAERDSITRSSDALSNK